MFLQISVFQFATGGAGMLFWCQELQAGDFEQLNVHLVFSSPNACPGGGITALSLVFSQISCAHSFRISIFLLPFAPSPAGALGNQHNLTESCCSHSLLVLPWHSPCFFWSHPCLENNHPITSCQGEECSCHSQQRVPHPPFGRG